MYDHQIEQFRAYAQWYAEHTPPPQRKLAQMRAGDRLLQLGVLIILLGAVVVSGSHTIPVFTQHAGWEALVVGVAAFGMIETALVVFGFYRVRQADLSHEQKRTRALASAGLAGVMVIAIAANVQYVLEPVGALLGSVWDGVRIVTLLAVGLSAPFVAYISGELLAIISTQREREQAALDAEYEAASQAWRDAALASYRRQMGRQVSVQPLSVLTTDADKSAGRQTRQIESSYGHTRKSSGVDAVVSYLDTNPSDVSLSVRDLGRLVGVSHDTAAKGKKAWIERQERKG